MNTKTKLAIAAILFSAVASPAFADDHDQATLLAGSGRIIAPSTVSANAYAAAWSVHHRAPAHAMAMTDFQSRGTN